MRSQRRRRRTETTTATNRRPLAALAETNAESGARCARPGREAGPGRLRGRDDDDGPPGPASADDRTPAPGRNRVESPTERPPLAPGCLSPSLGAAGLPPAPPRLARARPRPRAPPPGAVRVGRWGRPARPGRISVREFPVRVSGHPVPFPRSPIRARPRRPAPGAGGGGRKRGEGGPGRRGLPCPEPPHFCRKIPDPRPSP